MTYADFLLIFLIAPLIALGAILRRRLLDRRFLALAGGLALVALIYMAPWDHTAAVWGLWTWAPGRTWGARWWDVPPEEYLFCILEALLASTLIYAVLLWRGRIASSARIQREEHPLRADVVTTLVAGALTASVRAGWAYLPFLLVWALPVIGIQWALGGHYLWRERRIWPWVALGICAYLVLADAVAISAGVWSFDPHALTGAALGPVPLEEILFYLLTALMVTQGFVAFWYGYADRDGLTLRIRQRAARLAGMGRAGGSHASAPTRAERAQGSHDGR